MIRTTELLKHFNLYKDLILQMTKEILEIELHKAIESPLLVPLLNGILMIRFINITSSSSILFHIAK